MSDNEQFILYQLGDKCHCSHSPTAPVAVRMVSCDMTEVHSELTIELLPDPDTDDRALYKATERLRHMLLDLDVEDVERAGVSGNLAGSKGYQVKIGALIVRFTLRPDLLCSMVSLAGREWPRSVELTLDGDTLILTGAHSIAQEQVIDLWIAHHTNPE